MRRSFTRPLARGAVFVSFAAVVLYHVWLLGGRLADGSALEPLVAGRWLGSAALVAAALVLRRRGFAISRGRPALVFWLLVALLHGVGAVGWTAEGARSEPPLPAAVLWLATPLGLAATVLFWAGALAARSRGLGGPGAVPGSGPRLASFLARSAPLLAAAGPRAPPLG